VPGPSLCILGAMRIVLLRGAFVALLAGAVIAPTAAASPQSDTAAVIKDFGADSDITPCRFTIGQLENARGQLGADINAYSPGLRVEVNREITRWKDGGCKGKAGAVPDVRIVKVKAKGGVRKESVTLKNFGSKNVSLRRYALRDAAGHVIRFKKTTLKAGRSLVVVTGCRKGSKKALRKGSRYYGCRKTQFWDDAGDVVELLNAKGVLQSRSKYGTPPA
jgi:hypothetical protein